MQSEPLLRCQYSPLLLEENSIHYSCQHPIKSKKAEECKLYSRDIKLHGKLLDFRKITTCYLLTKYPHTITNYKIQEKLLDLR
jgi:hypothetical protein